jgi:hypothetical protein
MNNSPIIGVNFETKTRYKMELRKCLNFNKESLIKLTLNLYGWH